MRTVDLFAKFAFITPYAIAFSVSTVAVTITVRHFAFIMP
jgi:hypothetical protein